MGKNLKDTDVIRVYDGDAWDYTYQEITLRELKEFLKDSWNLTGGGAYILRHPVIDVNEYYEDDEDEIFR